MNKKISPLQRDTLIEVVNIGASNASTSLSKLLGENVKVSIPELTLNKLEKIPNFIGKPEDTATVVLLKTSGDTPGTMFLLFEPESTLNITGKLTKNKKKDIKILDNEDQSALRELGNILIGSCITSLANFLKINLIQSVPETATDMIGSVTNSILANLGMVTDEILAFKVDMIIKKEKIKAQMFFLFEPKASQKILSTTKSLIDEKNN